MNIALRILSAATAAVLLLSAAACTREKAEPEARATVPPHPASADELVAIARMEPTRGNNVRGTVRFRQEGSAVRVSVELTGLTPGEHGFHVHEHGDCSAPDGSSAGGHFNPTGHPHAGREAENRHIGDLGNLRADSSGNARTDFVDTKLALSGPNSILGRAVIVHAGPDDLKSQPSGDAGGRVACGTIELERRNL